jgi:hypothetical protein
MGNFYCWLLAVPIIQKDSEGGMKTPHFLKWRVFSFAVCTIIFALLLDT